MIFDDNFFKKFDYGVKQIDKFIEASVKDLKIAGNSDNPDIKFRFAYDALIKLGIALIAAHKHKISSRAGHHIKILEKIGEALRDKNVERIGEKMRVARNTDLYEGGIFISEKQAGEYFDFVNSLYKKS